MCYVLHIHLTKSKYLNSPAKHTIWITEDSEFPPFLRMQTWFSRPKSPGSRTHYRQSEEETKNIQVSPIYKTSWFGNLDHPVPT